MTLLHEMVEIAFVYKLECSGLLSAYICCRLVHSQLCDLDFEPLSIVFIVFAILRSFVFWTNIWEAFEWGLSPTVLLLDDDTGKDFHSTLDKACEPDDVQQVFEMECV
ncbi:hypothetical protein Tco_0336549 [Tanacetum coccineum]